MFQGDRDYIGFATLPEQVHRKSVKRGFDFTLMVVGESGLGKSTLVNSLFLSDLYKDRRIPEAIGKCWERIVRLLFLLWLLYERKKKHASKQFIRQIAIINKLV